MKKNKVVLKTGLTKLDAMIGGFKAGELTVIAGRPSMGKSAFLYTIINNGAVEVKKRPYVVCFQPDSSTIETRFRLDCLNTRVDLYEASRWRVTNDEFRRLKRAHKKIFDELKIWMCNMGIKTLCRIRKAAMDLYKTRHLKVIAIDYLQLLMSDSGRPLSRKDATKLCASLKKLAKQLNIVIILLSQVPRAIERRKPQIPILSDLKKYGEIEKYADKILFIYREEYYNPTDENEGAAKIIVAKNRDGQVGIMDVKFTRKCLRFDNA